MPNGVTMVTNVWPNVSSKFHITYPEF